MSSIAEAIDILQDKKTYILWFIIAILYSDTNIYYLQKYWKINIDKVYLFFKRTKENIIEK